MPERLLKRDARDLGKPRVAVLSFPLSQQSGRIAVAEPFAVVCVVLLTGLKGMVEDDAYATERASKVVFLLCGRVETVFVASFVHVLKIGTKPDTVVS